MSLVSTPKPGRTLAMPTSKKPRHGHSGDRPDASRCVQASHDQTNQFPRYPDMEVPQTVKDACCEEALAILERGNSQRRRLQQEGVQSLSVGGLSETYVAGARGGGLISQEAKELLRPWLLGAVRIV